jgi:hypothetical protein
MTDEEARDAMKSMDEDGNGYVEVSEFLGFFKRKASEIAELEVRSPRLPGISGNSSICLTLSRVLLRDGRAVDPIGCRVQVESASQQVDGPQQDGPSVPDESRVYRACEARYPGL